MYAEVLPNLTRLKTTFHYEVPPSLVNRLQAGHLVIVPFGLQRVQGVVLSCSEAPPAGIVKFKAIESLVDSDPVLSRFQLDLARWLSDHYRTPLISCVTLMLPPGMSKRADLLFELRARPSRAINSLQERIIGVLDKRGSMRGRQLDRALPRTRWRRDADRLVRQGVLYRTPVLDPPSVRPRKYSTVRIARPAGKVRTAIPTLGRSSKGADLLEYLVSIWPAEPVLEDLLSVVGCELRHVRALAVKNLVEVIGRQKVVVGNVPSATAQRWLQKRQRVAPRQAEVVKALIGRRGAVPLINLAHASLGVIKSLDAQNILRYSVNPRRVRLRLTLPQANEKIIHLRKSECEVGVLEYLLGSDGSPIEVDRVYADTGSKLADLRKLADLGLLYFGEGEAIRDSLSDLDFTPVKAPELVQGQRELWTRIKANFAQVAAAKSCQQENTIKPYLLHGVTGSGKTEIYLRAVAEALRLEKQSIVLVPEISLTPQTIRRFLARFPGRVAVVHSQLSDGERYDTWRRARSGAIDVVIGTRSALFAPLSNLGLIVVDEEHDEAYRQDPPVQPPHYSARDVAIEYAQLVGAICILGSATPDIVSYFRAEKGEMCLETLPERIMGHGDRIRRQAAHLGVSSRYRALRSSEVTARFIPLPRVRVVDMRHELRVGHRSMFSRMLLDSISGSLMRSEQIILFLNRRGQATYVFCRDCGHTMECRQCRIPFTYHRGLHQMICHHCNARRREPERCPRCRGVRVKYFGLGTEGVQAEVQRVFPEARTVRWDADVTRARGAHERILRSFREREADILIGTQMVAKGLDLPLVTLVGVISADVGLTLPDYRAAERTFQVLTQVAGRAGRGLLGGDVVLQTYMPEHYAIQAASGHDYNTFYARELSLRRVHGYPPYAKLARLLGRQRSSEQVESEANEIATQLRNRISEQQATSTSIIGPVPCFFGRVAGNHRWQVVLRGPNPASLIDVPPPEGWRLEVEPLSLL